jgi:hypothetical protein
MDQNLGIHAAFLKKDTPASEVRAGWADLLENCTRSHMMASDLRTLKENFLQQSSQENWEKLSIFKQIHTDFEGTIS